MSDLLEIEKAVSALPTPEQRNLLAWLQSLLDDTRSESVQPASRRSLWLERLAERRQRGATGVFGTPVQEILDELRGG